MRSKSISDEQMMLALLENKTIEAAAESCGITRQTIYKRLSDPEFKAAYTERRQRMLEHACTALQNRIGEAVETLAEIMNNGKASKMARVLAAKAVLEYGLRSVEVMNILPRLEALENSTRNGDSNFSGGEPHWE